MKLSEMEQALIRACGGMTMQRSTATNQNTVRALIRKGLAERSKRGQFAYITLTESGARVLNALRNRPSAATIRTAHSHRDADRQCGREWVCACAHCRQVRGEKR